MVHQSTRCKKLQRVFYCNLSKKVQSGAPSGDENSSGPPPVRRAKTPQWGGFRARESPRWCTRKSRNECCGFFVAPFPSGRTRTSRKRSCSSRGDWSLNSVRRTEFLTRPLMVHQKAPCCKAGRFSYVDLYWENRHLVSGLPFLVYTNVSTKWRQRCIMKIGTKIRQAGRCFAGCREGKTVTARKIQ